MNDIHIEILFNIFDILLEFSFFISQKIVKMRIYLVCIQKLSQNEVNDDFLHISFPIGKFKLRFMKFYLIS